MAQIVGSNMRVLPGAVALRPKARRKPRAKPGGQGKTKNARAPKCLKANWTWPFPWHSHCRPSKGDCTHNPLMSVRMHCLAFGMDRFWLCFWLRIGYVLITKWLRFGYVFKKLVTFWLRNGYFEHNYVYAKCVPKQFCLRSIYMHF